MNENLSTCVSLLHRGTDHRCVRAPQTCPRVPPRVCVRVWVWPHTYPRRNVRALSVGVDRVWLGSQAFSFAAAFNANIGAWNTASMTSMSFVCPLCHRLRVGRVCLARLRARRCVACMPSAAADSHACFRPCFVPPFPLLTHSSVLHSFLEYCMCTIDSTEAPSDLP